MKSEKFLAPVEKIDNRNVPCACLHSLFSNAHHSLQCFMKHLMLVAPLLSLLLSSHLLQRIVLVTMVCSVLLAAPLLCTVLHSEDDTEAYGN